MKRVTQKKPDRWENLKLFFFLQLFPLPFLAISTVSYLIGDMTMAQNGLEFFAFFFLIGLFVSPVIILLSTHEHTA